MEKKGFYVVDYGRSDLNRSFADFQDAARYIAGVFSGLKIRPLSLKRHISVVTDFTDILDTLYGTQDF